jgi:hypothetical protein
MKETNAELENLLELQDEHQRKVIEAGTELENSGRQDDALKLYQMGIRKARETEDVLTAMILGLLD